MMDRGTFAANRVVTTVLDCVTAAVGIIAAALVVAVLQPVLLALLVLAELPGGWAAVRSAPLALLFCVGVALTLARVLLKSVAAAVLIHVGYNLTLFAMVWFATDHKAPTQ